MRIFIYRHINSSEPLAKIPARNEIEATELAAGIKQMPIDDFLKIFKVEEYDTKTHRENRKNDRSKNGGE